MGVAVRNCVEEMTLRAPAGGFPAGAIINRHGFSWVKMGLQDTPEGETATFRRDRVVEIDKASASTAFDPGVAVGFNESAQTVEAAGAGDFDLFGTTREASGSGKPTVLFALNEYNPDDGGSD